MLNRTTLRTRVIPHIQPGRENETVVEVFRDGVLIALIYGSREGLHITSSLFSDHANRPFNVSALTPAMPGVVVPLLEPDAECPWCAGARYVHFGGEPQACPVCNPQ